MRAILALAALVTAVASSAYAQALATINGHADVNAVDTAGDTAAPATP